MMLVHFLRQDEINLIMRDFDELLDSHEKATIKLCYQVYEADTVDNIDSVYNVNKRPVLSEVKVRRIAAIHKIVLESDVTILSSGIVRIGDSIFYIHRDIDLNEPISGYEVVKDSFYILDANEVRWVPNIKNSEDLSQLLMLNIGDRKYCQIIYCKKFRTED